MNSIYLDYASTTPVHPDVLQKMLPFFSQHFGNSTSSTHQHGWYANGAIKKARNQIASAINCEDSEIVFTSGATESINQALRGIFNLYKTKGNHIVVPKTEHKAVLDTVKALEKKGAEVSYLEVDKNGIVTEDDFKNALKPNTVFAAVMWVNNETGVMQNVERFAELAYNNNTPFFCDATQAVGKVEINMSKNQIGAMCLSAHKFGGPKGVGALFIRRKKPRITLEPLITGGGQEKGLRAGTLNTPSIVGMGEAIEIACKNITYNNQKLEETRNNLKEFFLKHGAIFNEHKDGSNHILNITLPEVPANNLIKNTRNLSYSLGSACTSDNLDPSHVLTAMGLSKSLCYSSFRLSFSANTTEQEVAITKATFETAINALQKH